MGQLLVVVWDYLSHVSTTRTDPWSCFYPGVESGCTPGFPQQDLGSVSDCHLFVLRYEHNTSRAHSLFTDPWSY